ncbi:MAG: hypothetical protein ACK4VV_04345 [Pseudomonas sp.]
MTTTNDLPGDLPTATESDVSADSNACGLLWSPQKALAAKKAQQPWHLKGSSPRHEKKIGMAPSGTRRSMGKR